MGKRLKMIFKQTLTKMIVTKKQTVTNFDNNNTVLQVKVNNNSYFKRHTGTPK